MYTPKTHTHTYIHTHTYTHTHTCCPSAAACASMLAVQRGESRIAVWDHIFI